MIWAFAVVPPILPDPEIVLGGLVRVEDPNVAGAVLRSETGALIDGPAPLGTPWRPISIPEPDRVSPVEAVDVTNADLWIDDGLTGAGVRVAVFDIGWFAGETEILDDVTTHDCQTSPTCEQPFDPLRPNLALEGGQHGWACAEAIRAIAPEAELHLVRVNSFTMLENAVDWAIREDIDVISMSMSFYNTSFYDGGGPHDPVMRKLAAADVLMVTSAGNNGESHWSGPWIDADADGRLDGDGDNGLWIYLSRDTTMNILWNQFGRCGDTDLDGKVIDDVDRTVIGMSSGAQTRGADQCAPVEVLRARPPRDDWYRIEITHQGGVQVGVEIDIVSRGGAFLDRMPQGAVTDPGAHPLAIAVGAVRHTNYDVGTPEPFSAWGPNAAGVPKPDIAGPDGYSSDAYGPASFFGTSASTPVVAGLIAQIRGEDPRLSNREAFDRLAAYARDVDGPVGPSDPALGAGLARLPVRNPERGACGHRPLVMPLLLWPLTWHRRRRRAQRAPARIR